MVIEIRKPLLLPFVGEIKEELLGRLAGAGKVVFTEPGLDAAGLQLLLALRKEVPELAVELVPGEENIFYRLWRQGGACGV